MADEKKIIEITVDNDAAVAEIVRLREEVTKLNSQEGLTREEQEKNKIATKEYNDQIRSLQKEVQNSIKTDKAKEGSLQQMKAQLSNLTKEYNNLSKQERESAKGTELQAKIKGLSDELKANESAIGDNRRKVGDYAGEIGGLFSNLGNLPGAFGKMAQGAQSASVGMKALNATNPVGWITILVGLVANLIGKFMDFAPVADFMENSLAKLNAVFSVLKNNIIGVISGQKTMGEAFRDTTRDMADQVAEATRLAEATRDLEDRQEAMNVQQQIYQNQIDKLLLQSKNLTLDDRERMRLIDEALAIESKAFQERKKIADDEVRLIQDKLIQQGNLSASEAVRLRVDGLAYARDVENRKNLKDEEIKALATALERQARIEGESIKLREKALNRRDVIEEEAQKKAERRSVAKEKEDAKREQAAEKRVQEEIKRGDALTMKYHEWNEKQKAAIQSGTQALLDSMSEDAKAGELSLQKFNEAAEMIKAAQISVRELTKQDEFAFLQQKLDEEYAIKIAAVKKQNMDTAAIEEEYRLKSAQLDSMKLTAQLELLSSFIGNISTIFNKGTKAQKAAASAQALVDGTISGFRAFNVAAYASGIPVPYNFIAGGLAAAGVAAATAKTIKDIWAVPENGRGSASTQRQSTPAFSIPDTTSRIGSVMSGASIGIAGGSAGIASAPATSIATGNAGMMQAMQNIPAPIVTVKDIEIAQNRVRVVDNLSKI